MTELEHIMNFLSRIQLNDLYNYLNLHFLQALYSLVIHVNF